MKRPVFVLLFLSSLAIHAAEKLSIPAPLGIPSPAPATDKPYAPQPILPGGLVIPIYPEGSPFLRADKVKEAEVYNLSKSSPGRINWITNIHNPSIEIHTVDGSLNTGTAVILCAGGGHNTLNVGTEAADFVPFFYNYGINSIILRNRLRKDGYKAEVDAVNDAMQAIRVVRAHAADFKIDPNRIGIMGFSAGAELAAPAAVFFEEWSKTNNAPDDPFADVSARPDFVGIVYPGPTPFNHDPKPPVPRNAPPAFITGPGSGDRIHAIWADQYFSAMLDAGIPNIEMHIYGNGFHPGSGSTGGLTDRNGTPLGTWQFRFIDWARDLGFLQKPGLETKAAKDTAEFLSKPAPRPYVIRRTEPNTNAPARQP
jgi:endo-1,4-beta-xylanase